MQKTGGKTGSSGSPSERRPVHPPASSKMPARIFYAGFAFILIFCLAQTTWSFYSIKLFNLFASGGGTADPDALESAMNVRMVAEYITKITFGIGALCIATALMAQAKALLSLEQLRTPCSIPKLLIYTGVALIGVYCISQSVWFWRDTELNFGMLVSYGYPDPVTVAQELRNIAIARYISSLSLGLGLLCLAFGALKVLHARPTDS